MLSKERVQHVIDTLKTVKQKEGKLDLSSFHCTPAGVSAPTTLLEQHPCGFEACIMGYVVLTPEWKAAGGLSVNGSPTIKGLNMYNDDSPAITLAWFKGEELTEENITKLIDLEYAYALESEDYIMTATCMLCPAHNMDVIPDATLKEIEHHYTHFDRYSAEDLDDELFRAIYGKESKSVRIDDAIEQLQYLIDSELAF